MIQSHLHPTTSRMIKHSSFGSIRYQLERTQRKVRCRQGLKHPYLAREQRHRFKREKRLQNNRPLEHSNQRKKGCQRHLSRANVMCGSNSSEEGRIFCSRVDCGRFRHSQGSNQCQQIIVSSSPVGVQKFLRKWSPRSFCLWIGRRYEQDTRACGHQRGGNGLTKRCCVWCDFDSTKQALSRRNQVLPIVSQCWYQSKKLLLWAPWR